MLESHTGYWPVRSSHQKEVDDGEVILVELYEKFRSIWIFGIVSRTGRSGNMTEYHSLPWYVLERTRPSQGRVKSH